MPVNYSKWDNLDVSDDSDEVGTSTRGDFLKLQTPNT
jgi:hypothetical protein